MHHGLWRRPRRRLLRRRLEGDTLGPCAHAATLLMRLAPGPRPAALAGVFNHPHGREQPTHRRQSQRKLSQVHLCMCCTRHGRVGRRTSVGGEQGHARAHGSAVGARARRRGGAGRAYLLAAAA
jgi:hypothetical protein